VDELLREQAELALELRVPILEELEAELTPGRAAELSNLGYAGD